MNTAEKLKYLGWGMILAAGLAIVTAFLLPMSFIVLSPVKAFSNFIGSFAPCVSVMSERAVNPSRSALIWAVQWALFPMHLFMLWFSLIPPRRQAEENTRVAVSNANGKGGKGLFAVMAFLLLFGVVILSDFGIINSASFFRCSIFQGDVSNLYHKLRVPFSSSFGSALYALIITFSASFFYFLFFALAINLPTIIKYSFLIKSKKSKKNFDSHEK